MSFFLIFVIIFFQIILVTQGSFIDLKSGNPAFNLLFTVKFKVFISKNIEKDKFLVISAYLLIYYSKFNWL